MSKLPPNIYPPNRGRKTRPAIRPGAALGMLGLACLISLPPTAFGQNINKGQEAHVAVTQCYSQCLDRLKRDEPLLIAARSMTDERDYGRAAYCVLAQSNVQAMQDCVQGCNSIKSSYDNDTSGTVPLEVRFQGELKELSSALREAGLWTGDADTSPAPGRKDFEREAGSDFDMACKAFWEILDDPRRNIWR